MNTTFSTYLFSKLPAFFKQNDTLKNAAGEGLFERYLSIYGFELDEEIVPGIDNFINELHPLLSTSAILKHIAYTLGRPPDFFDDENTYRRLLLVIATIYKWKGTAKSYAALFGLFGLDIEITEIFEDEVTYDAGFLYDTGKEYDKACVQCSEYTIGYRALGDDCTIPEFTPIDFDVTIIFEKLICFLEPINAKLAGYHYVMDICEVLDPGFVESAQAKVRTYNVFYDTTLIYDKKGGIPDKYDDYTTVTILLL